jgi:hypothetical protein
MDFCAQTWNKTQPEEKAKLMKKNLGNKDRSSTERTQLSMEELDTLHHIEARKAMGTESTLGLDCFYTDVIDRLRAVLHGGKLGLVGILPQEH